MDLHLDAENEHFSIGLIDVLSYASQF